MFFLTNNKTTIVGIQTDDYKFDAFIEKLQEIVIEDNFEKLKETFMNKYYQEFEEQEENKLSYMNIFKEYTKTIESYIESVRILKKLKINNNFYFIKSPSHDSISKINLINLIIITRTSVKDYRNIKSKISSNY